MDSDALRYEVSQIPDDTRRTEVFSLLSLASEHLPITDAVEALALTFEQHGLRAINATHLRYRKKFLGKSVHTPRSTPLRSWREALTCSP
uniref:Uncharacterized protein n=1 Tax=Candidatus Kentrum sp. UNK TaxID=2126344 RepID=A0A451AX35_9GAMM|nr:MAG: hypothetical protein BECKUNK1418G_GA0071005_102728 [Candidatus Kentron sp. UNK]VFK70621.1 MAG: hypothetical protein BECKUNK1418H_GA0071006_10348 [Candidatus Kentron sp. UNK]